mmetsp:Transcript_106660/g.229673  ORF Transcript_106660/g.229673 Transcript_106660/m.229673 type:complete len:262 (-) Transcript_106660:122-907(-)
MSTPRPACTKSLLPCSKDSGKHGETPASTTCSSDTSAAWEPAARSCSTEPTSSLSSSSSPASNPAKTCCIRPVWNSFRWWTLFHTTSTPRVTPTSSTCRSPLTIASRTPSRSSTTTSRRTYWRKDWLSRTASWSSRRTSCAPLLSLRTPRSTRLAPLSREGSLTGRKPRAAQPDRWSSTPTSPRAPTLASPSPTSLIPPTPKPSLCTHVISKAGSGNSLSTAISSRVKALWSTSCPTTRSKTQRGIIRKSDFDFEARIELI